MEALSDDDAKVAFTLRALEQWEERWLMVFDNCDDPATFSPGFADVLGMEPRRLAAPAVLTFRVVAVTVIALAQME